MSVDLTGAPWWVYAVVAVVVPLRVLVAKTPNGWPTVGRSAKWLFVKVLANPYELIRGWRSRRRFSDNFASAFSDFVAEDPLAAFFERGAEVVEIEIDGTVPVGKPRLRDCKRGRRLIVSKRDTEQLLLGLIAIIEEIPIRETVTSRFVKSSAECDALRTHALTHIVRNGLGELRQALNRRHEDLRQKDKVYRNAHRTWKRIRQSMESAAEETPTGLSNALRFVYFVELWTQANEPAR